MLSQRPDCLGLASDLCSVSCTVMRHTPICWNCIKIHTHSQTHGLVSLVMFYVPSQACCKTLDCPCVRPVQSSPFYNTHLTTHTHYSCHLYFTCLHINTFIHAIYASSSLVCDAHEGLTAYVGSLNYLPYLRVTASPFCISQQEEPERSSVWVEKSVSWTFQRNFTTYKGCLHSVF